MYYGSPLTQSSWELATDVVIRSSPAWWSAAQSASTASSRGGDLAYVEERVIPDGALVPRLSARLARYIG